ncbi:MAG: bifunctional folylpolyglutamate synthase/dihydrofolate synthase [Dehalococcoidia bacterium]|nr:bifunctional folylpolyglutamate synthase/dihydrofolate synthase [Dehalococcoidia bacterium]
MDKYQAALDFLYSFTDYETQHQPCSPVNYDLRRMYELLSRLGDPQLEYRTVHIAGTKGKGSTSAMTASVLGVAGFRVALYTSPHLVDIRERFSVDGHLISRGELSELAARLKPEVEAVNAASNYGKLTTFEVLTALGFLHFAEKRADFAVIEVGLGGRLDATNVIRPEACAITTLGLDHTDVLGDTLDKIAAEKAGIVKTGVPVTSAQQPPEAAEVIAAACANLGAPLVRVGHEITYASAGQRKGWQVLDIKGQLGKYHLEIPLLGRFQQENAAVAVGVLESLVGRGFDIPVAAMTKGFASVRWPGRFQQIREKPDVIIDGAHNPQAAGELALALADFTTGRSCGMRILVIGASSDKNVSGVAYSLAALFDIVLAARSRHPRALPAEDLALEFRRLGKELRVTESVAGALDEAVKLAGKDGLVCATGSLFVAGEALEWARMTTE